jgi:hypothetical protein
MMKYKLSLAVFSWLLMAAQVATYGDWVVDERSNEATGTRTMSSKAGEYVESEGFRTLQSYFGLRCDVKGDSKNLIFIFGVDEPVAEPGSDITIVVKVDGDPPINITGNTFSGSDTTGYARYLSLMHRDLLDRLKAGNRAAVQVRSPVARVNYAVSLVGFTAANERILEMCRK